MRRFKEFLKMRRSDFWFSNIKDPATPALRFSELTGFSLSSLCQRTGKMNSDAFRIIACLDLALDGCRTSRIIVNWENLEGFFICENPIILRATLFGMAKSVLFDFSDHTLSNLRSKIDRESETVRVHFFRSSCKVLLIWTTTIVIPIA